MGLHRFAAAASIAALVVASPAAAAVTLYNDAAAFQAALASSTLETFDSLPLAPALSLDCTNCSIDLGSGRFVDQGLVGIGQRTRIKFATPITAWGAVFDETPSGFGKGLFISYRLTDGFTTLTAGPQLDGYSGQFFGFISDDPFVFVGISPGSNPAFSSERYNLDNMRFGLARVGGVAVPEPATWAMMIMGFGLAGAVLRRRRMLPA
jgi:hypothetical protein